MKRTKTKLVSSIVTLLVCFAMLIGSTFAWFTDSASTGVNKIQAGNLDVQLLAEDGTTSIEGGSLKWVKADGHTEEQVLWEPGATYKLESFRIKNNGNLKLKYKINISGITGDALLLNVLDFVVEGVSSLTSLSNLNGFEGALEPRSTTEPITIKATMKQDAGNEYQGLSIENIGITVQATQLGGEFSGVNGENDSFNNRYDENATYPPLASYINNSTTKPVVKTNDNKIGEETEIIDSVAVSIVPANTSMYSVYLNEESNTPVLMSDSGELERNIKTTDSTADSVTYDISYNYKKSDGTSTSIVKFDNIVQNVINVSTGLIDVKVTHTHGDVTSSMTMLDEFPIIITDNTAYYDSENGKIYVWSSAYSEFKVEYKNDFGAAVNGQGYGTLAQAISVAKDGDVVWLLKDCVLEGNGINLQNKSFILDGLDNTITFEHTAFNSFDENNLEGITSGNVEIYNTHFISTDNGYSICLGFNSNAKIKLYNCIFEDMYTAVYSNPRTIQSDNKSKIDIQESDYVNTNWGYVVDNATVGSLQLIKDQVDVIFSSNSGLTEGAEREMFDWTSRATSVPDPVDNVISINTPEELAALAVNVNSGNGYSGKKIVLNTDIDLSDLNWIPIGINTKLSAKFDGQNFTIYNLYAHSKHDDIHDYVALIAESNAELKNVNFKNVDIYGGCSAALVGNTNSKVENVHVYGTIKVIGCCYTGGIVCEGYGLIDNCSVIADTGSESLIASDNHCSSYDWSNSGGIRGFTGEGNVVTRNVTVKNINIIAANGGIGGITGNIHYGNTIENALVENCIVKSTKTNSYGRYVGAIGGRTVNNSSSTISLNNVKALNVEISTSAASYSKYLEKSHLIPYVSYNGDPVNNVGAILNGTSFADFGNVITAATDLNENEDNTIYLYGNFSGYSLTADQAELLSSKNVALIRSYSSYQAPTLNEETGYKYVILDNYLLKVVPVDSDVDFTYLAKNGNKYYTSAEDAIKESNSGDTIQLWQSVDFAKTLNYEQNLTIVSEVDGAVWSGATVGEGLELVTEVNGNSIFYSTKVIEEIAQAKIGDKYYPTLQLALNSSDSSKTVVLCNDVDLGNTYLPITKSGNLDLNGHKIINNYSSDGALYFKNSNNIEFSILDSIGGGEIFNSNTGTSSYLSAIEVYNKNATITISGGKYSSNGSKSNSLYVRGSVCITGGTFDGKFYVVSGGNLAISGGTFAEDPTLYLLEGYTAIKDDDLGVWIVSSNS